MPLTKKRIEEALGTLIIWKNGNCYIQDSDVDTAIQRITSSFHGCYAMVKTVGVIDKRLVIGNAISRVSKPLVEVFIKNDE